MKLEKCFTRSICAFWSMFLHLILLYSLSLLQHTTTDAKALGNETDRFALLKFKESISTDPYEVFKSWNDSIHFCNWPGIVCSRRHQRITALNLEGHNLRGTISPHIGNLSFLRFINLRNNNFFGEIPRQVDHLFRLRHLNLSNNMLEGKIPVNLSYCSKLSVLSLGTNKLTGMIPSEFSSFGKLLALNVSTNNLTGGIPPSLGNISSLIIFSAAYNNLQGNVPSQLGKLKNLTFFSISANSLFGMIPLSLYNISSMSIFYISANHFSGTLPPNIGTTLPNLQTISFGANLFSGTIPESFSNASQLQRLDIGRNNLFGQVPTSFGNLPNLSWLSLTCNILGNYSENSLQFIASLTNCSEMKILDFSHNNFRGILPNSLANLSTKLNLLSLEVNQIYGSIPTTLENLVDLISLGFQENLFTGLIPTSLGKLQNLQYLGLDDNSLSGKIPSSIGNLTQIFLLNLSVNKLDGSIPPEIEGCKNLQYFDISRNSLSGTIPKEVFSLSSCVSLKLSQNSLNGSLPTEVGKLKQMNELDLSENNLTSEIPETIGDCESLEFLSLQGNLFQGPLPSTVASLRGLQYLDVSRNNLTGEIPKEFEKLRFLLYLNISSNDFVGEVPYEGVFQNTSAISIVGNAKLCGGVPKLKLPRCPVNESKERNTNGSRLRIIITVCVAVVFILFSGPILFYWRKKSHEKSINAVSIINSLSKVSYKKLYQATNGFSTSMLIGTGSFGSVYKGILGQEEENIIAVKFLDLHKKGASKSFIAECNALRNIRHRNLVKILTCCSSVDYNGNDFKALVFQYMSNGSLEKWLHWVTNDGENQSTCLNFTQRLNIIMDVASAIHYLHEDCDPAIIHCDLKPSNILLDNEMIAHVSDFGLARLISNTNGVSNTQISTIGIKGTIGYAAPEYAVGGEPSRQGDVYTYGILVLEIFTGKRPTDEMFKDDFNLRNFVKMALPERLIEIVDSSLLLEAGTSTMDPLRRESEYGRRYKNNEAIEITAVEENFNFENTNQISVHLRKWLVSVLNIGLACSNESPNERMNMGDVIKELHHIKKCLSLSSGVGIHGQRQRAL